MKFPVAIIAILAMVFLAAGTLLALASSFLAKHCNHLQTLVYRRLPLLAKFTGSPLSESVIRTIFLVLGVAWVVGGLSLLAFAAVLWLNG